MTVKELIERLEKEDQNKIVVMAKDAEGNNYSPLADFWCGMYRAETTWYGEVGFSELTPELKKAGYSEEDIVDGDAAIILCPVN